MTFVGSPDMNEEVISVLKGMGVQGVGIGIGFSELETLKRLPELLGRIEELEARVEELEEALEGSEEDEYELADEPEFLPFEPGQFQWRPGEGPNRWRGKVTHAPTYVLEGNSLWVLHRTPFGFVCRNATRFECEWFESVAPPGEGDKVIRTDYERD